MKVLLLTPNFWTSGTVTFIRELQAGWPVEWPRPVIATATKSGKRSSKWGRVVSELKRADSTSWEPDVCHSREGMIEFATEFDLVHVNEVETQENRQEWWYELLERLRTPFTVQLHGNRYERIDWLRVLRAPRFTGVVWQTPGNVPERLKLSSSVRLVALPRPWNLRPFRDRAHVENVPPLVGFHGRFAPDKGAAHVAALVDHARVDVCMHGASPGGGYPYAYGLQRHLFGDVIHSAESPWVWSTGFSQLNYEGPYSDGVEVSRHHAVHVSATRRGFSSGTEYTVLEAADAGCRIVQPRHMTEAGDLHVYEYDWEPRGLVSAFRDPLDSLTRAVQTAVADSSHDPDYNRKVVASRHNPRNLARAFFGVAASRV